ncbi:hypothetical protein [Actinokineospora iranica]|uniref:hypothetical protein n=1 Tax=Actinokineospora iranica TaxID=1271860 RepID=UPI000B82F053|nr:hypothetical protein [Actinokineospora iranica]
MELTVDQQIDLEVAVTTFAESVPRLFGAQPEIVAGGGGEGGHYNITSLDEFESLIRRWQDVRDKIEDSGKKLGVAAQIVEPPADDQASTDQAAATVASLEEAVRHNTAMWTYAQGYIDKLTAARDAYAATEGGNADALRLGDGG